MKNYDMFMAGLRAEIFDKALVSDKAYVSGYIMAKARDGANHLTCNMIREVWEMPPYKNVSN